MKLVKADIVKNLTRVFYNTKLHAKEHSPEILVIGGVVGVITSTVMACKATTKLSGIMEKTQKNVDSIHYATEHPEALTEEYTEDDAKKDTAIVYAHAALEVAKLYAPSVVVGAVSIGCILTSHKIMRGRNAALAAAYTALNKDFKQYSARVIERFGAEMDKELRYNIKAKEIEETVTHEDGTEQTVTTIVHAPDGPIGSPYAVFFDECCRNWDKDPEYNKMFLLRQQAHATDRLRAKGYLYLNDVYEMIGVDKTEIGTRVGWVYDESADPVGDNYVDFHIFELHNPEKRAFVNGKERSILLDFNVDGDVYELIKKRKIRIH